MAIDRQDKDVSEGITPQALYEMAASYFMISRAIQVAGDLDIFTPLFQHPHTAEQLAKDLRLDPRAMEILLITCTALSLLEKEGELYSTSPAVAGLVVKGQTNYSGPVLAGFGGVYQDWSKLDRAVRTGQPVARSSMRKGKGSGRQFVLNMHASSLGPARMLAGLIDLRGKKKLLDVGGGAGTYAIILCQKYPQLTASVLDLPGVIPITKEIIAKAGLSHRIQAQVTNYTRDPFPEANDTVLLCNVLHQEEPPTCQMLLNKSYAALVGGGIVVVLEMLLNDEKTGPLPVALGALNNLVHHRTGRAHSVAEIKDCLQAAGFGQIKQRAVSASGMSLLVATKQ